jgi:hypothetical protein
MPEMNWFIGKTNKRIYHMMSKKFRKLLAEVAVKVNKDISKTPSMPIIIIYCNMVLPK